MLSNELELTLRRALSIATEYKHEYATYEHLLLALIEDSDVRHLLIKSKIDIELIRERLKRYIEKELVELVDKEVKESRPTAGFQRIVQRAALHSQAGGYKVISGLQVLAEFFFEHEAFALTCLKESNLSRQDVINIIKNHPENEHKGSAAKSILSKNFKVDLAHTEHESNIVEKKQIVVSDNENALEKYCTNLNDKAKAGLIEFLVGRQTEIFRTIEILCRKKKNNAILVGEPGVGKTAIAECLALKIVSGDVPEMIKDSIIYALDIGSLVAGTKYRGDFEERVKILINNLQQSKNAILFVDEIHTIIGAGSTNMGGIDASNLLKPALARGELRCIGSTTFKEYHNYFEKDQALVRRFQKIVISEPDEESTLKILQGIKSSYEKHHNVEYSESALKAAISLSERYISDRRLPDKAIDLIDEAGARGKMRSNNKAKVIITPEDIEELISSIANIPLIRLESDSIDQLKKLSDNLKNSVFGQDEAVDSLCSSIKLSIAGLRKSNRPTGCYVFAGQTGVGKTELAKQLANLTGMKLLKFDMSEYSEATSATKLIGSAPGYVGFDQGGILTNEVSKYPYAVLLFDEIEKSHPDIFNLFLQVMDEGKLTDNTGKVINFTHTIIIFTTNLVSEVKKNSIGFNDNNFEEKVQLDLSSFNENFSPEFRARLDKVILFNPIDDIVDKIVNKNLKELGALLADKKVRLVIGQGVRQFCAEYCFKKNNNAREIDRVIDVLIKQPIADEILFGKLKDGGVVVMDYSKKGGGLSFKFSSAKHIKNEELEPDSFFENCP